MYPSELPDDNLLLWSKFLHGDTCAFEKLMNRHYRDLFNYGTRFTGDKELVKDCIQDLFLVLWKNRSTVNQTNFVKFYLLKSLRRKLSKALSCNIYSFVNNELHFDAGFDDPVETKIIVSEYHLESSQKVRKLLATLSPREQEVIFLRFYTDVDYSQIAEIMSIHRQSAYNLLHDALRKLKKNFSSNKF